jgi:hypothetical protein
MPSVIVAAMPTKKKTHYTVSEAARKLKISRAAIFLAIRKGRLDAEDGQILQTVKLIPAAALNAYRVSSSHKRRGKKNLI